jgi:hypothetical protein
VAGGGSDTRRVSKQKSDVRRGRDYWAGVVGEFEGSGLTQREFCERRGLKFTAFRNWVYRVRGKVGAKPGRKRVAGQFVQIVPSSPKPSVLCKVQVGRAEIFFSELPPAAYLGDLLRLMDR